MTGERTLPGGAGLVGYFTPGTGGWDGDTGLDGNLRKIGAGLASQLVVQSRTTDPLPSPPAAGQEVYIVDAGDATNPNKIAVWDGPSGFEAWVYYTPFEGLRAYVRDETAGSRLFEYDGSAWGLVTSGGLNFSGAKATKTTGQTIPGSANTVVTWDAEEYDTDGYHDPVTNNDRITIPTTGKYRATFAPVTSAPGSVVWQMWITKNGTTFGDRVAYADISGNVRGGAPVIFEGQLNAGDILRAMIFCSSTVTFEAVATFFSIQRLE